MGLGAKVRRILNLYRLLWIDDRLNDLEAKIDALSRKIVPLKLAASHLDLELPPPRSLIKSTARVSIILSVYNDLDRTHNCLQSILRNTYYPDYEIIVADNASTDGTAEYLGHLQTARVRTLLNSENPGFVEACIASAKFASGDYLIFLDNHATVQPGWLTALAEFAEKTRDCGAVGSMLLFPDGTLQEAGGVVLSDGNILKYGQGMDSNAPRFNFVREVDYCSRAGLLIRSTLWRDIGGFDRRFAPGGYEDVDFCFEIRKQGGKVYYQPKSMVVYDQGTSTRFDSRSHHEPRAVHRGQFLDKWPVELQLQYENRAENIQRASDRQAKKSILVVDRYLTFFDRHSGSLRLFHILKLLKQTGFHVTLVTVMPLMEDRYRPILEDMGVEVHVDDRGAKRSLGLGSDGGSSIDHKALLVERHYEYAILEFWQIAEYYLPTIRKYSPKTHIIIDTVDVHFLREIREAELRGSHTLKRKALLNKKREMGVYGKADRVWVVTQGDRDAIASGVKNTTVDIVPNIHQVVDSEKVFEDTSDLLFVGNFWHQPNVDAIQFFCKEILPLLRDCLKGVKLLVVGDNVPTSIESLASDVIVIVGHVRDLVELLARVRVSIAPLRFGAGMKGKIGEALAHGVPVVTTSVGAEGMGLLDGQDALIADEPKEFADRVVRLYTDRDLWKRLSTNGLARVREHWSPETVKTYLEAILR